jgi:hypothetical protein
MGSWIDGWILDRYMGGWVLGGSVDRYIGEQSVSGVSEWSEDSQRRQRVKYGHESRGTRNHGSLSWRGPALI